MRSYTNKKGEIIAVSEDHLQTAVEIKKFLQKNNSRCSWSQHRQLMIKEGYTDSENSEAYRQMIKNYQSSIGELPSAQKHAEMLADNKLSSLRDLVGDLAWEKREMQKALRDLNKGKRDIIDNGLFIQEVTNEIRNVLSDVEWDKVLNRTFEPLPKRSGSRMILILTDWHIGAMVDVESNKYDFKIARKRIQDVVQQTLEKAREEGVYRIDVVYCGDILEHAYMRDSQSYSAEFPVTRQMVLGGRLIIEALYALSKNHFVSYRGFAGNHDRFNKDKNGNIDGDTGMVVVNEMVQLFIETAEIENLVYAETHSYWARLVNVNGRNFKFVHGDLEKIGNTKKLAEHSHNDNIVYDAIIYGHFHHFRVIEVGNNKYEIGVGSLKGADEYSEKMGYGTMASQALIIVDIDGNIYPHQIKVP